MNAKEILNANITLCNVLMRILARFKDAKDFKKRYMNIVEDFEKEQDIMPNRIKLRKYLRELVINQKRVLQAALDQDYLSKVKQYFFEKKQEEAEKWKEYHKKEEKKKSDQADKNDDEDDDDEEGSE